MSMDPAAIAAEALRIMSMSPEDGDAAEVEVAAASAVDLVTNYIGADDFPTVAPTPVLEATALITVELYRRKDATFGVLNTWNTADFGPVRIGPDWLKGVEAMLHPYMRDSYGVG